MAERERRMTRPYGGVFVARAEVMSADEIGRALRRMAHEIIERNHGLHNVVLIGLQTGGVVVARALRSVLAETYGTDESPRFVNGLLAAAAQRLRPEDESP